MECEGDEGRMLEASSTIKVASRKERRRSFNLLLLDQLQEVSFKEPRCKSTAPSNNRLITDLNSRK